MYNIYGQTNDFVKRPGLFDNILVPPVTDSAIQKYVDTTIVSENPSVVSCTVENTSYVVSSGELQLEIRIAVQTVGNAYTDILYMPL